jgi:hypothetical protein
LKRNYIWGYVKKKRLNSAGLKHGPNFSSARNKNLTLTISTVSVATACTGCYEVKYHDTFDLGRLCGLVVSEFLATDPEARVRFPTLPEKKVVGLERGPLSLVSTSEELLDRKVVAPV